MNQPDIQSEAAKTFTAGRTFLSGLGEWKWMLPFTDANSIRVLKSPGTWALFLFAYTVLPFYQSSPDRQDLFLFLMIYFALAWAACFYAFIAKGRTSFWIGIATAVFTRFVSRWFGHLLKYTILAPFYRINDSPTEILKFIGILGSYGFNEELLKILPVLILAFVLKRLKTPIDGMFYGAMSGLSFGAWEGFTYLEDPSKGEVLIVALVRITSGLFMHAAYTAIAGYFVAQAATTRRRVALCAIGIGLATILHTCFDFAINSHGPAIVVVVFLLFIAYASRSQEIAEQRKPLQLIPAVADPKIQQAAQEASILSHACAQLPPGGEQQ